MLVLSRNPFRGRIYLGRVSAMSPRATFSAQTLAVLSALASEPSSWRHGYDLARETELKSGTLYPILVRLADRGIVEARWEEEQPAGRPRRHLYRLTTDGLATAAAASATPPARASAARLGPAARHRPAPRPGQAPGRLAGEGT
jgi:PadR family transcriptional regulator